MLKIKIPNIYQNKQNYILDILLKEFLGLSFEVETNEGGFIVITKSTDFGNLIKLTLDASFFYKTTQYWLKAESMPNLPLANWTPLDDGIKVNLTEPSIPVLYGSTL